MLSEDVKDRLSIAFASTKENIDICRKMVIESSIPSEDKNRILEDLADVENVIEKHRYEDVDAIEEAITALEHSYAENLAGEGSLKDSLGYILQWLEYIKKTLGYEGLVSMKDDSDTIQNTSLLSNYGYIDDSGTFIPTGSSESRPQ